MTAAKSMLFLVFVSSALFGAVVLSNDNVIVDPPPVEYDFYQCTMWLRSRGYRCQPGVEFAQIEFEPAVQGLFETKKCCPADMGGAGCYSTESGTAWHCDLFLPDCLQSIGPRFFVYSPERSAQAQELDFFKLNHTTQLLDISSTRPFVAISHGFGGVWPIPWMFNMKDRLVALGYNVLILQWTGGSHGPNYFQAASNTRSIGRALAVVMKSMQSHGKISLETSTIVGFSLGAHVAGAAGRHLQNLRRIIGLDPAGPMFQCMDPEARLDKSDAKFVQVIHTNGEYFLKGGAGTLQPLGHMDVYVNEGMKQPGCPKGLLQSIAALEDLNFDALEDSVGCSHMRMRQLFIEMLENELHPLKSCRYFAIPCASPDDFSSGSCFKCPKGTQCPIAGIATDITNEVHGQFFLNTLSENATTGQFCGRQYLLTLTSDVTVKGLIHLTARGNSLESRKIYFQGEHAKMPAGVSKKRVIVVPWQMTNVQELHMNFTADVQGVKQWTLESMSLKDLAGQSYITNGRLRVDSGKISVIQLQQRSTS